MYLCVYNYALSSRLASNGINLSSVLLTIIGMYVLVCSLLVVSPHLQSIVVYINILRYPFGDLTDLRRFGLSYRLLHICVYTYIHTYIYTYCTYIHTCPYAYIDPSTSKYIHTRTHIQYIYTYIHTYLSKYSTLIELVPYLTSTHLSIHTYIHTNMHTYRTTRNIAIVTEDGLTLQGWHLIPPIDDIHHNPLCSHLNVQTECMYICM